MATARRVILVQGRDPLVPDQSAGSLMQKFPFLLLKMTLSGSLRLQFSSKLLELLQGHAYFL